MYFPSGAVKMFNFGNENSGFIIFLIVAKSKMSKKGYIYLGAVKMFAFGMKT